MNNLTSQESYEKFTAMLSGKISESEIENFLLALKEKGETAEEILGAAKAMRALAVNPSLTLPSREGITTETPLPEGGEASSTPLPEGGVGGGLLDVCGTGGDGLNTLNISTAVAFIVAACGVKIAKHGNKAVSSASGSSDVLSELGIKLDAKTLEETNFCYLHAPSFHPGMKYVAPVRAKLKTRTIFNLLGPLCSPAQAKRQLIGVYDAALLRPFAEVLRGLGTDKAWIVHGNDGLDEISISTTTQIAELDKGAIDLFEISPEDFGLKSASIDEIRGGNPKQNAAEMRELFQGKKSAYRDIVLLNSAAALLVADEVETIENGIELAANAIDSGKVTELLEKLTTND